MCFSFLVIGVHVFVQQKLFTIFVQHLNKGWRWWTSKNSLKRCISKNTKDKIKCRDCHIIMTSCMTSPWHHPWHHYDIIMKSSMTSLWHHAWHHPWHHHDIIHDIMGPTTWHHPWHLSLSIQIHLTSVPTSVQRWSRQHIQCISLQYIFYTCIIQPTKFLHQLYGLGLAIGLTLGPKPNLLNQWT